MDCLLNSIFMNQAAGLELLLQELLNTQRPGNIPEPEIFFGPWFSPNRVSRLKPLLQMSLSTLWRLLTIAGMFISLAESP